jgi:site-specific DNA recombinase
MNIKNCAIYTRKSHAEGLDQEFNSLDAQREACEAFITSQKHEGWSCNKAHYDDGAYSGGNLNRPALERLLNDIKEGNIQVVVVYKVDRLTRNLADFAKLIELFDKHEVSFVSVTQQFNTTSSMGRLTLNVLLSFAQFEREITGERIRDKFKASKEKGMWMGGYVPLGYEVNERQLIINPKEAKTIKYIFEQYLALGNVRKLKEHLDQQGVLSKVRVNSNGVLSGGKPISRGNLYRMLGNPIYKGDIRHKDKVYAGQHDAIIDNDTWDKVQRLLKTNNDIAKNGLRAKQPSILAGVLYDDKGNAMSPSHAVKNGKRYRYYTSQAIVKQQVEKAGSLPRIPAGEIESVVTNKVQEFLQDEAGLNTIIGNTNQGADVYIRHAKKLADEITKQPSLVKQLLSKVIISAKKITLIISRETLHQALNLDPPMHDSPIKINAKIHLKRCQGEKKLILTNGQSQQEDNINPTLVKAVSRAYVWNQMLVNGEAHSIKAIAEHENITSGYVRRLLPLAFLSPNLIEDILDGKQDPNLSIDKLC